MRKLVTLLLLSAAAAVVLAVGTAGAQRSAADLPSSPVALKTPAVKGTTSMIAANNAAAQAPDTITVECNDHSDNDSDGYIDYPYDPGCSTATDDSESPDPPPAPPPPPPPPPPPDMPLYFHQRNAQQYEECEQGLFNPKNPDYPCLGPGGTPTAARCKRYVFENLYTDTPWIDVARYEGAWRVCYNPNGGGIRSVTYRYGEGTWSANGWAWDGDGNESGYPNHVREPHVVRLNYRMSLHLCIHEPVCAPMKHPWTNFTFKDTGRYGSIDTEDGIG